MAIQNVIFSATGGKPTAEILIGQAHHGSYRVYLWDSEGKNPVLIGSGTNWDNREDVIELGPTSDLNKRIITWEIAVSAAQTGPGQTYSVTVTFKQDGSAVGIFNESGSLNGSKFIFGVRQLLLS
jgi:hypothetical protein